MSNSEFKKFLLALVEECDVDLSDLAESQRELKAHKRLAMIPADKLAARIYATLDVHGSGGPLRKEVMMGPLAEALSPYLAELDADQNGRIAVQEWNDFLGKREKAFGADAYSQWLRDTVWESGIDASDLVSANFKAVEEISKLGSDALLAKIWETLDSDASGSIERNELLYSSIKELLYADWAELDADASGRISQAEYQNFMKKLKHKKACVQIGRGAELGLGCRARMISESSSLTWCMQATSMYPTC